VTTATGGLVLHRAPDGEEGKALLDRKLGFGVGQELCDDWRGDAIELEPDRRRVGRGAAPLLDQRFDSHLVLVRESSEANAELADLRTAIVGPDDATHHLNR
jgi:hypothetical protein